MLDRSAMRVDRASASSRGHIKPDSSDCGGGLKAILVALVGICMLVPGCQDVATVWEAQVRSPDGHWIASARTQQHGGPGTAGIVTTVYLEQPDNANSSVEVLGFFCDGPVSRPFRLDNVANAGGTIDLKMKWTNSSHLDVTYDGHASLDFQVAKVHGIEISVQNLSNGSR